MKRFLLLFSAPLLLVMMMGLSACWAQEEDNEALVVVDELPDSTPQVQTACIQLPSPAQSCDNTTIGLLYRAEDPPLFIFDGTDLEDGAYTVLAAAFANPDQCEQPGCSILKLISRNQSSTPVEGALWNIGGFEIFNNTGTSGLMPVEVPPPNESNPCGPTYVNLNNSGYLSPLDTEFQFVVQYNGAVIDSNPDQLTTVTGGGECNSQFIGSTDDAFDGLLTDNGCEDVSGSGGSENCSVERILFFPQAPANVTMEDLQQGTGEGQQGGGNGMGGSGRV